MKLTMTKVLTPLAAAALAFSAQAAQSDGFESGTWASRANWAYYPGSSSSEDESAITAYGASTKPGSYNTDEFSSGVGDNYLAVSPDDGMIAFTNKSWSVDATKGLYIDTDVQFTVTDVANRPTPTADDKFIIWLEANGQATNLCVYARQYKYNNSAIEADENCVYTLSAKIEPNTWHRLLVKAVRNANGAKSTVIPGFEVYIDGVQQSSSTYILSNYSAYQDAGAELIVSDLLPSGDVGTDFFPAMADGMTFLTNVCFAGEGAIDNLVVTDTIPNGLSRSVVTYTWPENTVASITVNNDSVARGEKRVYAPGTALSAEAPTGYKFGSCTYGTCTEAAWSYTTENGTTDVTVEFGLVAKDSVAVTLDWDQFYDVVGDDSYHVDIYYVTNSHRVKCSDFDPSSDPIILKKGETISFEIEYLDGCSGYTYTPAWSADPASGAGSMSGNTFTVADTLTAYSVQISATATKSDWAGAGTAANPYVISDSTGLSTLNDKLASDTFSGKYFKLGDNVNAGTFQLGGTFAGVFNGDGHTITFIPDEVGDTTKYAAFFQKIDGATISNVTFAVGVAKEVTADKVAVVAAEADGENTLADVTVTGDALTAKNDVKAYAFVAAAADADVVVNASGTMVATNCYAGFTGFACTNLAFASIGDNGMATNAELAVGGSFKAMNDGADASSFKLNAGESITIEGLADGKGPTTDAANKVTKTGNVYTCTAKPEITTVTLSADTVEYGTTTLPTATVTDDNSATVESANYDLTYDKTLEATTAAGTVITVTATAKGDDYTGSAEATFTVVAKSVTPTVTLAFAETNYVAGSMAFPAVTVKNGDDTLVENTDYTYAWNPNEITEPSADTDYTVTVTLKGNYSGSNTAKLTVKKVASGPEPVTPEEGETPTVTPGTGEDAGKYVVDPKGQSEVTLTGAADSDIIITSADDTKIKGAVKSITVRANGCNITDYVKGGNATDGFDTALSTNAVRAVIDDMTDIATPFAAGDTPTMTVKAIPGLTYTLKAGQELTGSSAFTRSAATATPTTSDNVTLTDNDKPEGKCFYRVDVSK